MCLIKYFFKAGTSKVDPLPTVIEKQNASKDIWREMVKCFTSAGVPLKVFRNDDVRKWIESNIKDGIKLPGETTLRKFLSEEGKCDSQTTAEICRDQDVIVTVDESMDLKNRKLVNVLVGPAQPNISSRLVASKFVQKCDAAAISNVVLEALSTISVKTSHLVCLKSDNAKYMLSAGNTLKGLSRRMIHSTCWSHILHLVSEEIRGQMKKADLYISAFKSVLVKAPSRRDELLDVFEDHGHSRTLPPVPVITRWCTWLEAASFHYKHLEAEATWVEATQDNSAVMHKLKKLCRKDDVKGQLEKLDQVCTGISSSIKILEKRHIPASDVWLLLQTVLDLTNNVLGKESEKLNAYLEGRHPAISFWHDVQYFDPRKADQFVDSSGHETLPVTLKSMSLSEIGIHEIYKYKTLRQARPFSTDFCVFNFWKQFTREMPELSKLAITALCIPASSAEVERSFSTVRRILTAQRNRFTEENLGIHLRMCFNQSTNSEPIIGEFDLNMESESDNDIEIDFE